MIAAADRIIRCAECLQELKIDDDEVAVSWVLNHECRRPQTVYVVLVDWGTADGRPCLREVDSAYSDKTNAVERVKRARRQKPFPAVSAEVIEELVR